MNDELLPAVKDILEDPLSITTGWLSEHNSVWPKLYITDISDYLRDKVWTYIMKYINWLAI